MKNLKIASFLLLAFGSLMMCCGQKKSTEPKASASQKVESPTKNPYYSRTDTKKLNVSNEEWKKILPKELYQVSRLKATEMAFTGKYNEFDGIGTYYCAVCGNALFRSDAKFASTCGWPSFYKALSKNSVKYEVDTSYDMVREEVLCGRCDSHLGHRFEDGPPPTGYRYCMNSVSLEFEPDAKTVKK